MPFEKFALVMSIIIIVLLIADTFTLIALFKNIRKEREYLDD